MGGRLTLVLLIVCFGQLALSPASYALNCDKAERYDEVLGFAAQADGARATWVVREHSAPYYYYNAEHVNHTIWVGANGALPKVTNVEVGTLKGSQNGDLQNNWTYYSARAINNYSVYNVVNFPALGPPDVGGTHTLGAAYLNGGYEVYIDSGGQWHWPSLAAPTVGYDVGWEAICAHTDGYNEDRLDRTYVSKVQSRQQAASQWIQSDHGSLKSEGANEGDIQWCNAPFTFRDWLHSSIGVSSCS